MRYQIHAFHYLGDVARELWYDNLATAVAEHDGNLVRFHPRFLAFAREYSFLPRACHEKEKSKDSSPIYGQSFWPLRSFTDISDVNLHVREWLEGRWLKALLRSLVGFAMASLISHFLRAVPV